MTSNPPARPVVGKLVRDRIPEILSKLGVTAQTRTLAPDEWVPALRAKLDEEIAEYDAAQNDNEAADELVDILEVVYALAAARGTEPMLLDTLREQKLLARGQFKEGVWLEMQPPVDPASYRYSDW